MIALQLATPYNAHRNYRTEYWYATPKYDGVRAVYIPGEGFINRQSGHFAGFEELESVLGEWCAAHRLDFIDGEMYSAKGFEFTQHTLLYGSAEEKAQVSYYVFACDGENICGTMAMLEELPDMPERRIHKVQSYVIDNTPQAIKAKCQEYVKAGYEGIVLRHPEVHYCAGRKIYLVKQKPEKELDMEVVGCRVKKKTDGKKSLTLYLVGEVKGEKVSVLCHAGLTRSLQDVMIEDPALIGRVVSVRYEAIYTRQDTDGGKWLRGAAVIGAKLDRVYGLFRNAKKRAHVRYAHPESVEYCRLLRIYASLKCSDVAKQLYIAPVTLYSYEDGKLHMPSETCRRYKEILCEEYGIDPFKHPFYPRLKGIERIRWELARHKMSFAEVSRALGYSRRWASLAITKYREENEYQELCEKLEHGIALALRKRKESKHEGK